MNTPLLNTKLYIPPVRPELIPRQHLVDRLNAGLDGKLTLISAPAGFGKTTLISEWVSKSEIPFCWVSLDENDNDPGRFLAYLISSFNTVGIEIDPEPIKLLQNPEPGQIEAVLNGIINQIADAERQFAVVFDDYQHIQDEEIHQLLAYLLEHLPPNLHIVIATRADPSLPVPRLRARGELTELRSADLRFNLSEGDRFLNRIYKLGIQPEAVEQLISRTDGWAAGLQLVSIALRGRQDTGDYIQRFSGSQEYIVDFLTAEVLEDQSEEHQAFLMRTAILKRLNASLCNAVTGQENSQDILKVLVKNNIFIQALDDDNHWFVYHQLFRDLLTQQLLEKYPDELPDLYLKASNWCEEHGLINDAVDYALRCQDMDKAADLVESRAQRTIQQSEIRTFLRWVDALPENQIRKRPELSILYAWALLVSNQKPDTAKRLLNRMHPENDLLRAKLSAVRSIQAAFQRRVPEAVKLARGALDQLPDDEYFFRQITAWNLSAALFLSGRGAESVDVLEEIARMSQESGNRMIVVVALCRLGNIRLQQGELYAANDYFKRALHIASENRSKPMPVACEALIGLGRIAWEWYQFENASQMLVDGIEQSRYWREVASIEGYITLAHLRCSQGDFDGSKRIIAKTKEIATRSILSDTGRRYVFMQEAHLQLRQGDLPFAVGWAKRRGMKRYLDTEELESSENAGAVVIRNFELNLYARILMSEKRYRDAIDILTKILPAYARLGYRAKIVECHILMALTQDAMGQINSAKRSMKTALDLAAQASYLRVFIDEGSKTIQLVEQTVSDSAGSNYAQELLAAWQHTSEHSKSSIARSPLVEALSDREKEILGLLVSELSVPEIAANIHISVSTLRTHIRNIYRKMDTHSRHETVSKARDMKLI